MFGDLAVLAAAHRLILTNTTFGYWGGYIADALNQAQVWVPSEHELKVALLTETVGASSTWLSGPL